MSVAERRALFTELERWSRSLKEFSGRRTMVNARVREAHDKILALLHCVRDQREVHQLLRDEAWIAMSSELTALNAEIHRLTEIDLARQYIEKSAARDPFEGSWINKGFTDLLRQQANRWKAKGLFRNGEAGPVVVVGGGAMPQTQVALHHALQCDVVSVDRDEESVEVCRRVLRRAGYRHLRVAHDDGVKYDYSDAYLVVVATLVADRHLVAKRVARTSAAFFAPRTPVALHAVWRKPVDERRVRAAGWRRIDYFEPRDSSVAALLYKKVRCCV